MTYTPPDYAGPHYRQALEAAGLRVVSAEYLAALEQLAEAIDDLVQLDETGEIAFGEYWVAQSAWQLALDGLRIRPEWQQRQEQQ